jgi:hypothetical protein
MMKRINIRGIFTDPTELGTFVNCSNQPCFSLNSDYPLNGWMWTTLVKPYIVQELLQKSQTTTDDSNDTDDTKIETNGGRKN